MALNSKIEWTHHTANLWHGCTKVHEGCDNCYAEALAKRYGHDIWGADKPRKEVKSVWKELDKFQKLAKGAGEVHHVFVGSMQDIFEKAHPVVNWQGEALSYTTSFLRNTLFNSIEQFPDLMFLFLTKRPSNINKYIPDSWKSSPPLNVMFGTSPVNQETANKLIPQLLQVNGKRFLSVEPQLDFVELKTEWLNALDWVIVGGESGHGRRPYNADWARGIREQCRSANIPFFMKQMDKVAPIPSDLLIREFPKK